MTKERRKCAPSCALNPAIAPIKVGVFPLLKNKPELVEQGPRSGNLTSLKPMMQVFYDEAGAIGRRYRRQDEIGTPFCRYHRL
jgi:glycyl-tRNA synthetase